MRRSAPKSRAKKSNRRVIRKGRPVSDVRRDAGGPSSGPFDGEPRRTVGAGSSRTPKPAADPADSFDPFESFDEHDRAAGIASPHGESAFEKKQDGAATEAVYSRSRRPRDEPGASTEDPSRSKRPGRSLKGRALGYLSRREYSRAELSRKLMPFADEANPLEALLDTLEREGWLSDSRFAESLIHRRASRLGTSRIVGELKRHAVSQTLIEETGAQLRETELARAQAVWSKKYGELPQTLTERARQARFLAARGFSQGVIGKILKGIEDE